MADFESGHPDTWVVEFPGGDADRTRFFTAVQALGGRAVEVAPSLVTPEQELALGTGIEDELLSNKCSSLAQRARNVLSTNLLHTPRDILVAGEIALQPEYSRRFRLGDASLGLVRRRLLEVTGFALPKRPHMPTIAQICPRIEDVTHHALGLVLNELDLVRNAFAAEAAITVGDILMGRDVVAHAAQQMGFRPLVLDKVTASARSFSDRHAQERAKLLAAQSATRSSE